MIWPLFFFIPLLSLPIAFASASDDLLVALFLDNSNAEITPEARHEFLLMKRSTIEEYDEVLDRLVYLYMKHFYKSDSSQSRFVRPQPYMEYETNMESQDSRYLIDFVEGMPKGLLPKFIMVPPCRLRRVMFERGQREGISAKHVFELLQSYHLPYGPYTSSFFKDMDVLIKEVPDDELALVEQDILMSRDDLEMTGIMDANIGIFGAILQRHEEKNGASQVFVECADLNGDSQVQLRNKEIQSSSAPAVYANSGGMKRRGEFTDPKQMEELWPLLPFEIREKILSLVGVNMRLVCKAASLFSNILNSPSRPLTFLTILCGEKSDWDIIAWACTGAFENVSQHDIETITVFLNKYAAGSFELEKYYTEMCNDPHLAFEKAVKHIRMSSGTIPSPDSVQSCLLASLVFERGAFGSECDQVVRDMPIALSRLYFPDFLRDLEAARDEHRWNDICALLKDPRVPWYWTFVFFGELSVDDEYTSIRQALFDEESQRHLTELIIGIDRIDYYVVRIIYQRLVELVSSAKGIPEIGDYSEDILARFRKRVGIHPVNNNGDIYLLTVPEKVKIYFDGCFSDAPQSDHCPTASGSILAELLMNLLYALFNNCDSSRAINKCLRRFRTVLGDMKICDIPIQAITEYLETRSDHDLYLLLVRPGHEALASLVDALNYSPLLAFPKFAIKFLSTSYHNDLLQLFIQRSFRKGATQQDVLKFFSQLIGYARFQESNKLPVASMILGRRLPCQIYGEREVLIRVVRMKSDFLRAPLLIVLPGDATALELYCRVADRIINSMSFVLKRDDGSILLPNNAAIRDLANKPLLLVENDQSLLTFLSTV